MAVVDFGLYDALRGRDDFAQQRQDAALNANYIGQLQKQAADKLAAEQLAQQGVLEHLNTVDRLSQGVQPIDTDKIKDFIAQRKQSLIDSIGKFGGDIDRWKENGGNLDLQKYEDSIQNDKDESGVNPIAKAIAMKNAFALAEADKKSGLQPRGYDNWDFLNQDKQDYNSGKLPLFQYQGAYKPTKYNINDLENRYGANPYTRQGITKPEVIANMAEQGLDPEQIRKDLPKFFDASGKSLFYHKYDRITPEQALQMKKTQLEIKNQENKNAFDEDKEQFASQKWGQVQNVLQGNNYEPFNPDPTNLQEIQLPNGTKVNNELGGTVIPIELPQYKYDTKSGHYVANGTKLKKVPVKDVLLTPDGQKIMRVVDEGKTYSVPINEQNAFSNILEPYAKNIGNYDEMLRSGIKKKILTNNGFNWSGDGNQVNLVVPRTNQSEQPSQKEVSKPDLTF